MGLHVVPTTSAFYDHARIHADRLIGYEGQACRSRSPRSTPGGWAWRRSRSAVLDGGQRAKLIATDVVQVLGGVGYTRDYRVERYMREAKIIQIFEGTNQIQRVVIARALTPN
jgi:alkylation response protein AidB-like acyl-CoA dehydrogenase